jgi:hypothetical protein
MILLIYFWKETGLDPPSKRKRNKHHTRTKGQHSRTPGAINLTHLTTPKENLGVWNHQRIENLLFCALIKMLREN